MAIVARLSGKFHLSKRNIEEILGAAFGGFLVSDRWSASPGWIRPTVWWRRGSFGTHGEQGNRFVESLLTVSSTRRPQGRNILGYPAAAIQAHLQGQPAPSLIPAPSGAN